MKEDFLHYIWKNGFFKQENLTTTQKERLVIVSKGIENKNAGPDFLEAKILIDDILWVGNIEIHKSSSDWYAHNHEKDAAYDNVILHIVYKENMPVYNSNNVQIPTLEIGRLIPKNTLKEYNKLIKNKSILRCQNELKNVDKYIIHHFKYKLFFERLEYKYEIVKNLLKRTQNNWEQVFYETLLKYFGGVVNKDSFELLAHFLPYQVINKYRSNLLQLEALLFGVSGLLQEQKNDSFYLTLQKEFEFLKEKHQLEILPKKMIKFHRLRPMNFPTIRLSQFANLFHNNNFLFNDLMKITKPEDAYRYFNTSTTPYWENHYNFDKMTKTRKKYIGNSFIDIILINVIIPLKFAYQKYNGNGSEEEIVNLIKKIKPEKNRIVTIFSKVDLIAKNALDTQAIIQINENYCNKKRCLHCDIGHSILKNKTQT